MYHLIGINTIAEIKLTKPNQNLTEDMDVWSKQKVVNVKNGTGNDILLPAGCNTYTKKVIWLASYDDS